MNDNHMTTEEAMAALSMTVEEIEEMGKDTPENEPQIGKYGLLARDYLKEHHPERYTFLMLEMTLQEVLLQVDRDAREMMDTIQSQLRKQTPRPKGDFMATVQYETAIRDQADEIILTEIVYKRR